MDFEEYARWLSGLVDEQRLDAADREVLLEQRQIFDSRRAEFEASYAGKAVGVASGEVLTDDSVNALLDRAEAMDSLLYFERIPESVADPVRVRR
ncbi:hypothetical protein [Mycolicibacterium sp.]|uniref:hypothetical protein n=1 Tax=Mycolicibacterium sp. TaxID=2320850 RepID=UPI00355D69B5